MCGDKLGMLLYKSLNYPHCAETQQPFHHFSNNVESDELLPNTIANLLEFCRDWDA